ncbi:phage terminase small subunit [Weissella oryzae SG25]|uniref:Phage terminase small subunit n=1 Tax=Weissella oryzae (strain DSM 25784 / JCM 18191 / LMG 30913 / SG25) TaxID=1329250 RepID=A0A069CXP3_WEIOS|nr:phage terminase small subunit P27 family [Weissella oryzae]GAK32023.1 phage terminase small subunit [Weissella oryzae SG25]
MKKADKDVNDGRLAYRPPDYLGTQAKAIWRKVVGFLEENTAVNRIDSNLVEMYCTQYEIFRNAYKHIQENGEVQAIYKSVQDSMGNVIATDFVGYKRNPMTQIYDSAIKNLTRIAVELGLTPKSRVELMNLAGDETTEESASDKMKAFFSNSEEDSY